MLRISKLTDYAILVMVELTREGEVLSAHALADRVGIEAPTASKVLKLLAGNLSNKQIASAMGVGDQTIKWHLKNMFTKLQAGSRKHLVGRARMLGILE